MFVHKRFRYAFIVQAFVVAYATCAAAYGIRYALEVMSLDATISSTVTMPQTIVQFILGLFMGSIMGKAFKKRFRPVALLGIACYAVGLMIFYFLTPDSPVFIIYLATGIGGIGQAVVQATFAAFYQSELKPEEIRPAQGMYQFASTGGSSVFTAIVGAAMTMGMGLQQVFLLGTAFMVIGFVFALIGFRFPKEEIEAEAAASR
jgi:MFS family permease